MRTLQVLTDVREDFVEFHRIEGVAACVDPEYSSSPSIMFRMRSAPSTA